MPNHDHEQILQRAHQWLRWDPDANTRAVVQQLVESADVEELAALLSARLEFGKFTFCTAMRIQLCQSRGWASPSLRW